MKKTSLFFTIVITLLSSVIFLADNAFSEEENLFLGRIKGNKVLIRSGYNENFNPVLSLNKGDLVVVKGKHFSWYKIALPPGADCYLHSDYIDKTSASTGIVKTNNLNVRSGPGSDFPILGQLHKDQRINIKTKEGDWYKIFPAENTSGWVHEDYLENAGSAKDFLEKKQLVDAFEKKFSALETTYQNLASTADKPIELESLLKEINSLEAEYKEYKELISRIQQKKEEIIKKMNELNIIQRMAKEKELDVIEIKGKVKELGRFWRKRGTHKLVSDLGKIFYLESQEVDLNIVSGSSVKVWGVVEEDAYYRNRPLVKVKKVEYYD